MQDATRLISGRQRDEEGEEQTMDAERTTSCRRPAAPSVTDRGWGQEAGSSSGCRLRASRPSSRAQSSRTRLREEIAEEGVRLYRRGMTLAQAAAAVGMALSNLFGYCVANNVVLLQDPSFFSHMAALGRSLNLPALTAAAEELAREEQRIALPA